jgi:rfaE bifunctional protein nucleotidyltransferase chain/domain
LKVDRVLQNNRECDMISPMSLEKLKSPEALARISDGMRAAGRKLVFTNGCFDLLHAGHVRYLQQARALGDALLVALNGDASVRGLKGPGRPLNCEEDRAEVLSALACVDYVTIFQDERVTALVSEIKPQIYAKGGDYTVESLNPGEVAALRAAGAEIKILPLVPGRSTTSIIERMGTK